MILLRFLMPEVSKGIKLCKNAIHTTYVQKNLGPIVLLPPLYIQN